MNEAFWKNPPLVFSIYSIYSSLVPGMFARHPAVYAMAIAFSGVSLGIAIASYRCRQAHSDVAILKILDSELDKKAAYMQAQKILSEAD